MESTGEYIIVVHENKRTRAKSETDTKQSDGWMDGCMDGCYCMVWYGMINDMEYTCGLLNYDDGLQQEE